MWGDSRTTDNLTRLLDEVKSYVKLEKEYLTLDLVEKLSKLFSAIVLGFVLMCLGIVVLFYLSSTIISLISSLVGETVALALVTLVLFILLFCIYYNREKWIVLPITQFVAGVLLNSNPESEKEEKEEQQP